MIGVAERRDPSDLHLAERFVGADYIDVFELTSASPEERRPEEIWRAALDGVPNVVYEAVKTVHRRVLGFSPVPTGTRDNGIGWQVVESTDEVAHFSADGPLMAGTLLLRRIEPSTTQLVTALTFKRRTAARLVWRVVGPLHRLAAPNLLERTVGHAR